MVEYTLLTISCNARQTTTMETPQQCSAVEAGERERDAWFTVLHESMRGRVNETHSVVHLLMSLLLLLPLRLLLMLLLLVLFPISIIT